MTFERLVRGRKTRPNVLEPPQEVRKIHMHKKSSTDQRVPPTILFTQPRSKKQRGLESPDPQLSMHGIEDIHVPATIQTKIRQAVMQKN